MINRDGRVILWEHLYVFGIGAIPFLLLVGKNALATIGVLVAWLVVSHWSYRQDKFANSAVDAHEDASWASACSSSVVFAIIAVISLGNLVGS